MGDAGDYWRESRERRRNAPKPIRAADGPFTDEEKRACAEREAKFRRRVYARRVADGKMTEDAAARELALMLAIAEDYRIKTELPL